MINGPITDQETEVREVGKHLAELSKMGGSEANEITVKGFELKDGDPAGSPAQQAIYAIGQALAMSEVTKSGTGWHKEPKIGPNEIGELLAKFDIKIVFEEQGQCILLVPDKANLELGLQKPPMFEFGYVMRLDGVKGKMKDLLNDLSVEIQSLTTDTDLKAAVKAKTAEFIAKNDALKDLTYDEKVDVFHDQLGAYACRQCG